jgi:integrase/recombinase XerD
MLDTLRRPIEAFLADCRARGLADGSLGTYAANLLDFTRFLERRGVQAPESVRPDDVDAYFGEMAQAALSALTIRSRRAALSGLYGFLLRRGAIERSPVEHIRQPRRPKRLPRVFTPEEVRRLLRSPKGDDAAALRDRALFELAYSSGCRASELLGLSLADMDIEERTARVLGKGDRERLALFGETAAAALREWIDRGRPALVRGEHAALFVNARGGPLSRDGFWRIVRRRGESVGVQGAHPHAFRHTCATDLLRGGANLREVQELMGHEDIGSTVIYTHVDRTQLRRVHAKAHPRR